MWIKVCGVTHAADALAVAEAGADAIGLNFFTESKRAVDVDTAADIVASLPSAIAAVGVFVNHSLEEIHAICTACHLRHVQLHGDEPPAVAAALQREGYAVIRAIRVGQSGLDNVATELSQLATLQALPWSCLIDAHVAGSYGGTGQTAPWELLARSWHRDGWPPLILAGGLTPDNVSEAIRLVRPWGVDVASGVEAAPGVKDLEKVRCFVRACRGTHASQASSGPA